MSTRAVRGLILAGILSVAAYVRLTEIDLSWFLLDQARDARTVEGIVQGRAFPLVGPEVEGWEVHTWGPLYFYLLAVPFGLSPDPVVGATFLSALNLIAVYLTYRFGAAFFGGEAGLIGAALFATYPLAVISSRVLWNVAPLPLFTVAFFACVFALVVRRRSAMIIPALVMLACLLQLHLSALSLVVVLALALVIYRVPIVSRHLILGAAATLLVLLPYMVALAGSGGRELLATLGSPLAHFSLPPAGDVLGIIRRLYFTVPDMAAWMTQRFGDGGPAGWLFLERMESGLMLLGAVYPLARLGQAWTRGISLRDPAMARHGLLALWLWTPPLLIGLKPGQLLYYYFDILYPAPFVAGGVLLSDVAASLRRGVGGTWSAAFRATVLAVVLLVVVSQVDFMRRLWALTVSRGQMPLPAGLISWSARSVESLAPGLAARGLPDLDMMPARYSRRIAASVVAQLGMEGHAPYRRVHGSVVGDLLQDKGFFFEWLSRSSRAIPPGAPGGSAHIALLRPGLGDRADRAGATHWVGPFAIITYVPSIDYTSWEYRHDQEAGTSPATSGNAGWVPLEIPTRAVPDAATYFYPPLFDWSRMPVLTRGVLIASAPPHSIKVVVSIMDRPGSDHQVDDCWMNDQAAPRKDGVRYYTPNAINSETIFDLSGLVRSGRNVIVCRITGRGTSFDLDVYELR